jgi:multiple sugar transport system substrate-binding protein
MEGATMASSTGDVGSNFSRRNFLKLGGFAGLVVVSAGCGAGGGDSGGGGGGATTLQVLVEAGGKAELTPVADAFKQKTGTTVTLVELPYEGLFNRLSSELSSGSLSFDVAALDAIWLPTFAGALQPLDELFTDEVKADLFPGLITEAQVNGKFIGMPVWTNAEILFYRKDLFDKAKLEPPKTWQEFQDTAKSFTDAPKLYGTDVKGAVETEWLAHVLQAGAPGVVLDPNGQVIIDNPQHLEALTFYSDLNNKLKVAPTGAAQLDWAGAQNLFYQGKTAMLRFWAHAYPLTPKDSPVNGKVGVAPMIAGSAGVAAIPGAWYLSVPAKGKNNAKATEFIKFAYDNNALSIESDLGLAARRSAFDQYASKPGYEHFKPLLETLAAPQTKPRPATPKWQQIVDTVLVPTLQKSLKPGADYAALLTAARGDVEKLVS